MLALKNNPADLINVTIEQPVRERLELPGYTTLDRIVARNRAEVSDGVYGTVISFGRRSRGDRPRRRRRGSAGLMPWGSERRRR